MHGFGGGYLSPVVPAPGRPIPTPGFMLAAGMTVVVQPNVVARDQPAGVQAGELLLVTDQEPQRLHSFPQGLQQVSWPQSEHVAQQVHVAIGPGRPPGGLHHQRLSVLGCGQPQRGVVVDLHQGTGIPGA